MSVLLNTPFNYTFDQIVRVRVSAANKYGYGNLSAVSGDSGARIRVIPVQMAKPTMDPLSTDKTLIMNWIAISGANAGNSPVIAYSLLWDAGDSTKYPNTDFVELTNALVTSYTKNAVTGGQTYRFMVRARNIYGYGANSTFTTVIPDDKPGKTNIPRVTLANADATSVDIEWDLPNEHSSPIISYSILFMQANGDFVTELTNCGAGVGSAVVAARKCSVPMTLLRTLTLRPRDSLIRVKIRGTNLKGDGEYSEVNTVGATIETEPTNLSVASIDVPSTFNDRTKVVWTALTGSARGGWNVDITSYEVYWDQSTGVWVSLANTSSLFTIKTDLTGGVTYKF